MDLGIAGRKAIVCASSKGLGRACALALAEAGCEVVMNGRNPEQLALSAQDLRKATGASVREVAGDLDEPATRAALIAACRDADILVNNNSGPPFKPFEAITREDILKGAPASRSAWRTQFRSVSPVQPIFAAIDAIAAHCDA